MANYNLMINSKFQPFSFERYMQPISMYAQQYENRYKEMQQQALVAGLMGSMVDPEVDKETYEALQKYNNNLQRMSDIMSTVGLPPNQRKNFLDLWKQYATDVMPIENWAKMRNADIEKQSNLYAQTNGNVVFTKNAKDTSLDYYRKGKPLNYEFSNLNAALQEASTAFATWAKTYRDTEEGRAFNDAFITYKQITGIKDSNKVITDLLENNGDQYPELKKIMTTLQDKYGVNNVNFNDLDRAKIQNTLTEGALLGMASAYDEKTTIQEDPVAKQAREDASWYNKQSWLIQNDPGKQKEALEVQALLGQLENPDEPNYGLDYIDAPINENFESYGSLRSKLYNENGNLITGYTGQRGKFVNPMAVYDQANKVYQQKIKNHGPIRGATSEVETGQEETLKKLWKEAVEEVKRSTGVSNVLSKNEYEQLKKLGYTNKSTFADFHYLNDFNERVNKTAKKHSTTDLNMTSYERVSNKAFPRLATTNYPIFEYDRNTGNFGKEHRSTDVFKYNEVDGKRVKGTDIEAVGYNINHKGYALVYTTNGKQYYVPLAALGENAANVEKRILSKEDLSTPEREAAAQNTIAVQLREDFNNQDQIIPTTSSQR